MYTQCLESTNPNTPSPTSTAGFASHAHFSPNQSTMLPMAQVWCPYCGEPVELAVDDSAGSQAYVEDCPVCCRPIVVEVRAAGDDDVEVVVRREDEA